MPYQRLFVADYSALATITSVEGRVCYAPQVTILFPFIFYNDVVWLFGHLNDIELIKNVM